MLSNQTYLQMGYTLEQIKKAEQLCKQYKIDMFQAFQYLQQNQLMDTQIKNLKFQKGVPGFSYLINIKNFKLSQYQILYTTQKQGNCSKGEFRQPDTPVGLMNVSNCCYLNSLLQCYYLMGSFTRQILQAQEIQEIPTKKSKIIQNEYKLLEALKQTFARMKLSSRKYLNPTPVLMNLINSVGEKIEYGDQKDLNQINMEIVDRLSECLLYTKKYYSAGNVTSTKLKKRQNIKRLFYGEKVQFIEENENQNVVDFMGIIIHPKQQNLINALQSEFNYQVEIDGKVMTKHTFIRVLPTYLFLTINRTQFKKMENKLQKNRQKLNFDFEIYLDNYLQVNKNKINKDNEKIKQLQRKKNNKKKQLGHFQLLINKLEECKVHTQYLKGWQNKLPKYQNLIKQKQLYINQLNSIQNQLANLESRKQQYILFYLFVHRGDAASGHYWGYGRNGDKWYKFDVNCTLIKQQDILSDMQQSNGIPYALVYCKKDQIESFDYPYYTTFNNQCNLLSINENKTDYFDLIPIKLKKMIISQNIVLHTKTQKLKNRNLSQNILKDYTNKYKIVKSQTQKYINIKKNINVPLYINFACFLESINQSEMMKFNLFQNSLLFKANITCNQLIRNEKLLKVIQSTFRKKLKGLISLRHFAIQYQPLQGDKYKQCVDKYLVGKKCLQFIRHILQNIHEWPNINNLYGYLEDITQVVHNNVEGIYLKSLVKQMVSIILLDLAKQGKPLKLKWSDCCQKQNPLLKNQLKAFNVNELSKQQQQQIQKTTISEIELQKMWQQQNSLKNIQIYVNQNIKNIAKLSDGISIYRTNTLQKKLVKNLEVQQKPIQQQSLI